MALIAHRGAVEGEVLRQTVMIWERTYGFAVSALEVAFYHLKEGRNVCLGKEEEMGGTTLVLRTAHVRGKTLVSVNFFRALGENYMTILKSQ